MIINGGSRKNGSFFSRHLMRADQNERVDVVEMRGLGATTVADAFREMKAVASGTQCKNFFYHANLNTRADELLTPEQWAQAVDKLENDLHLAGQPRFIVQHEKDGRIHQHVIWSRIDADSMTAIPDSHNYRTHELVAAALEKTFGHEATERALTRDKATVERPEPNVKDWESFRAANSQIDPKELKAELTELWNIADSGQAFAAALAERGYLLAKGDRRDFCVVDAAGDEHSLGRRISGVKAAEIRARMSDIDRDALPTVAQCRAVARARQEQPAGSSNTATQRPEPEITPLSRFDAILAERVQRASVEVGYDLPQPTPERLEELPQPEPARPSMFDTILARRVIEAQAEAVQSREAERRDPGARFALFRAWLGNLRDFVLDRTDYFRQLWSAYAHRHTEVQRPGVELER